MNLKTLKNRENVKLYNWNDYNPDKDVFLYKIFSYENFLKWIKNDEVRFNQVSKWEDVYELFLFKQNYKNNGNNIDFDSASKAIYGQSWSLDGNSDALWRIYSPDKLSVKIKVSTNKIIELLNNSNALTQKAGIYIGKVEYYDEKTIIDKIKNEYIPNGILLEETIVDSLFVKRDSFSYEKEVRIVLWKEYNLNCPLKQCLGCAKSNNYPQKDCQPIVSPYLNLKMHPADFIEEVEFDFRLDDNLCSAFTYALQNLLPNKVIIKKSSLGTIKKSTYNI